ncbi:MAG: GntR family transcriptional regulator [Actinomycetia bacterium]|nr:GntR family transcriptional regulator [Actinomycetes bacterium]
MTIAPRHQQQSYVSIAYQEVRSLILSGELEPGSRVTVRPLVDRLDLSPTPIRTALATLERQGMLEIQEHRGYFVPTLGRDDMIEIYELREAVDSIASRRAAHAADRDTLVAQLTDLLEQQRSCIEAGAIDEYAELDMRFHRAIWDSSGNDRLATISENLVGQLRIGNNISVRAPGRPQASLEEHRTIIEAIRDGDAPAAERATRRHVRRASAALAKLLDTP